MPAPAPSLAAIGQAERLLAPSYASRLAQQFFTHSAHAPITILILEWLVSGPRYFAEPDGYVLLGAALLQAAWLARSARAPAPWALAGNLVGVGAYTLAEGLLEGGRFLSQLQHAAYWLISGTFALLQGLRSAAWVGPLPRQVLLLAENVVRAAIPVMLYATFEARMDGTPFDLGRFFSDQAHVYLSIVVLLLGLLLAFADLNLQRTQAALRQLAARLHELSSWGFGSHVVAAALRDAQQVALQRRERAVLFMDIRGFTAWSESQSPEAVVAMLNDFYRTCESVAQPHGPIKVKFTADEMMAVFADPAQAFAAARLLQRAMPRTLAPHRLGAGIGLHCGPVVEGMLGSASVKAYEVIGDVVNTAARLCAAAAAGELLASLDALPSGAAASAQPRRITVKGKREPLAVYVLT